MLMDMEEFEGEEVKAWSADLKFGHEFRKNIDKMAIVGDKKWEKLMAHLAKLFYAHDAKYFHTVDRDAAWAWLRE